MNISNIVEVPEYSCEISNVVVVDKLKLGYWLLMDITISKGYVTEHNKISCNLVDFTDSFDSSCSIEDASASIVTAIYEDATVTAEDKNKQIGTILINATIDTGVSKVKAKFYSPSAFSLASSADFMGELEFSSDLLTYCIRE